MRNAASPAPRFSCALRGCCKCRNGHNCLWGNIVAATPGVLALFFQWWRGRKSLTVKIHDPGDRGLFPPILEVIAVNNGFRPLHLEQVSIVLKGGEEIVWAGRFTTHDDLPCELLEGKKFTASIRSMTYPICSLRKGARALQGYVGR